MSYPKAVVTEMLERRSIAWLDVMRVVEVGSTAHGNRSSFDQRRRG